MYRYPLPFLFLTAILLVFIKTGDLHTAAAAQPARDAAVDYLAASADWYFDGDQSGDNMGFSVAGAGDINADGYSDIIIGAPFFTTPDGVDSGAAFLFLGAPQGLRSAPDWVAGSAMQGSRFGWAVSHAGDVNGDGFDDILIGASEYKLSFEGTSGEPQSGAAFLYLGSAQGLSQTADWVFYAESPKIGLGASVAAAGDVNNDGYDDILVGAPKFESTLGLPNGGKIYLFLGSEDGPGLTPDWTYQCMKGEASCGYALASAGDVNNDSFDDIIIGAPHYNSHESDEGAVFLFYGSPTNLADTPDWSVEGDQPDAWFGVDVAAAGDLNQDGFSDLVVGSSLFDRDQDHPDVGAAFVYLGSPDGPSLTSAWVAYGSEEYARFGRAVSAAGDINQDGYADLLVGAYFYGQNGEESQPNEGAAYIFLGGFSGPQQAYSWSAYGNKADTEFGYAVSAAGDVNGDGGADIIIGAPQYRYDEKTVMGRAFVYLNTLNNPIDSNYIFIPFVIIR